MPCIDNNYTWHWQQLDFVSYHGRPRQHPNTPGIIKLTGVIFTDNVCIVDLCVNLLMYTHFDVKTRILVYKSHRLYICRNFLFQEWWIIFGESPPPPPLHMENKGILSIYYINIHSCYSESIRINTHYIWWFSATRTNFNKIVELKKTRNFQSFRSLEMFNIKTELLEVRFREVYSLEICSV